MRSFLFKHVGAKHRLRFNDMGSADYREQFNHALSILEAAKVGYVHLMDGLAFGTSTLFTSIVSCCLFHTFQASPSL
jgi:hypothetical protein